MDEHIEAALMAAGAQMHAKDAEIERLRRQVSGLKGLLACADHRAVEHGRELADLAARAADVASEREANALLTAELADAQKQRDTLQAALLVAARVLAKVDPKGCAEWMRAQRA